MPYVNLTATVLAILPADSRADAQLFIAHNLACLRRVLSSLVVNRIEKLVHVVTKLLGSCDLGKRRGNTIGCWSATCSIAHAQEFPALTHTVQLAPAELGSALQITLRLAAQSLAERLELSRDITTRVLALLVALRRRRWGTTTVLAVRTTNLLTDVELLVANDRTGLGRVIGALAIHSVQEGIGVAAKLLGGALFLERGGETVS